ncbi:hypothetical protein TNCV_1283831 [Trichonephila clavipes]|uniref:Uncharacterized protein n=1 Tax=Trichonephila clavipes TaxID=2585209 RepID=A0A8X6SZN9_TRICX|nr:hypothetical protein TNCV_1283831 [Trichonephila clavipes]
MALSGSLPQINLGVQGETQGGSPHNVMSDGMQSVIISNLSELKRGMIVEARLPAASVQNNQPCGCFKDHCVKGYDSLHKYG